VTDSPLTTQTKNTPQGSDRTADKLKKGQKRTDGDHDYVLQGVYESDDLVVADKYKRGSGLMIGRKILEPISSFIDETEVVDDESN